jgi:hypothetical protein
MAEKMNWDCYPEHLRPSEPPTDEEVGTHELTEEEIVFARAHRILRVEEDGCGFVPKQWLEQLRKFRDAMRQPSLLRRIMPPVPVAGAVPHPGPLSPGRTYECEEPKFVGKMVIRRDEKFELPKPECAYENRYPDFPVTGDENE